MLVHRKLGGKESPANGGAKKSAKEVDMGLTRSCSAQWRKERELKEEKVKEGVREAEMVGEGWDYLWSLVDRSRDEEEKEELGVFKEFSEDELELVQVTKEREKQLWKEWGNREREQEKEKERKEQQQKEKEEEKARKEEKKEKRKTNLFRKSPLPGGVGKGKGKPKEKGRRREGKKNWGEVDVYTVLFFLFFIPFSLI